MKKSFLSLVIIAIAGLTLALAPISEKLISKTGHISFFSHTDVEDITAHNYKVVSTLTPSTGEVVFSVSMQAFEFEKALMQKHYNSPKFLDTKTYPKAKLKGFITNLASIDFSKDGSYPATVEGSLELHGITKPVTEKGIITVEGSKVSIDAEMTIILADYEIAFDKGKPSTNISKEIKVTIKAVHTPQS